MISYKNYIIYTVLVLSFLAKACEAEDLAIDSRIKTARLSKEFKAHLASTPSGPHIYYRFLEWWSVYKLSQPTLDASGSITHALLTEARGFGGWDTSKSASKGECAIYHNAGFLAYWGDLKAPYPKKGPAVLTQIWKNARQKNCLLGSNLMCKETSKFYPRTTQDWLNELLTHGWKQRSTTLNDALNDTFKCCNSNELVAYIEESVAERGPNAISVISSNPNENSSVEYVLCMNDDEKSTEKKPSYPFSYESFIYPKISDRVYYLDGYSFDGVNYLDGCSFDERGSYDQNLRLFELFKRNAKKTKILQESNKHYRELHKHYLSIEDPLKVGAIVEYEGVIPWSFIGEMEEIGTHFEEIDKRIERAVSYERLNFSSHFLRWDEEQATNRLLELYRKKYEITIAYANEGNMDNEDLALVFCQLTYPGSVRYVCRTIDALRPSLHLCMLIGCKVDGSRVRNPRCVLAPQKRELEKMLSTLRVRPSNYDLIMHLVS